MVIERKYGKGSIVVASDSYFVSNECLHHDVDAGFLLWLLGGKSKVVFDETIHGSRKSGGAMILLRKYRAHGIFLGLFVVLALWAWRSSSSLVPGSDAGDSGIVALSGSVSGEATGSGLIRLLRRSIPIDGLVQQCHALWKSSLSAEPRPAALEKVG